MVRTLTNANNDLHIIRKELNKTLLLIQSRAYVSFLEDTHQHKNSVFLSICPEKIVVTVQLINGYTHRQA